MFKSAAKPIHLDAKVVQALKKTALFRGVSAEEISAMSGCLNVRVRTFERGETILRSGDTVRDLGVVVSGSVHIVRDGYWGDENLMSVMGPGNVFAENYACMRDVPLDVNVFAADDTCVAFLNVQRVSQTCSSVCPFHQRLSENLINEIAHKNLNLSRKMSYVVQRSTRKKVMAYLSSVAMEQGSPKFEIPMNRQELADYLAVDRSALSTTLGKLKSEGVISFSRNHFELKQALPDA